MVRHNKASEMSNFYTNVQAYGNYVLFRGIINGKRYKKRLPYKPRLYTLSKDKNSPFKTLYGQPLDEIEFDSINDCKEFKKKYKHINTFKMFGDNKHEYSFISDYYTKEIEFDFSKISIAYIDIEVASNNGFPEPEQANEPITAITIWLSGKFHVFGYGNGTDQTFNNTRDDVEYYLCDDEKDLIRKFVALWKSDCPDIVTGWNSCRSLKMGNGNPGFDWSYTINRMQRLFMGEDGEDIIKHLSPWGWVRNKTVKIGREEVTYHEISGVAMIDYIDLYTKFSATPSQESYKLDYIGSVEVDTQKINYDEYESLHALFLKNYQKFIEYNIGDVELVMKIEAKNALIEQIVTLAYDARVNFEDVFSQVRMWDTIIMNHLKNKGIMMPPKKENPKNEQFVGGYVKDPRPGMYKWLASLDFTSLYPMLIMMYNISPETLIQPETYDDEMNAWMEENQFNMNVDTMLDKFFDTAILKKKNACLTPNKQLFRTDVRGFLPEILDRMYKDRAAYKKKMNEQKKLLEKTTDPVERKKIEALITKYNNLQASKKIQLNSSFGAVGNQYFRFFDVRLAEAITMSGRLSVQFIQKRLNSFINEHTGRAAGDYVVASDTDSVYITLDAIIDKAYTEEQQKKMGPLGIIRSMDKLCEKVIGPRVLSFCDEIADYTNAYEQKLDMKREALCDKGIWVKKKNYMLNIYNMEGIEYAKPKLKITGMAAIKSSTPGVCRKKVKEAYELIINAASVKEIRDFNAKFKEEFFAMPVQDIASPTAMHNLDKYDGAGTESIFKKKTPAHVKGALVFNNWLRKMELIKKYQFIKEGEKLKFVYLKEPNPLQSEVVSFTTILPAEFGIHPYIDWEHMYEKNYLVQIQRVTDAIGWQLEEVSSLEGFFE